jgi:hypothetical protein
MSTDLVGYLREEYREQRAQKIVGAGTQKAGSNTKLEKMT